MACYMTFPVGSFYMFNRPELFFEKDVIEIRQNLYPPEDTVKTAQFKKQMKEIQMLQQEREFERQQMLYEKRLAQSSSRPEE